MYEEVVEHFSFLKRTFPIKLVESNYVGLGGVEEYNGLYYDAVERVEEDNGLTQSSCSCHYVLFTSSVLEAIFWTTRACVYFADWSHEAHCVSDMCLLPF